MERFQREARLLAQLNHENIATIHGLEEHDGHQFLIMELVGGETLAKRIANGPLSIDEGLELFLQIADGLEAAHAKGILHRDLKPPNIKVAEDGKPKILDFGLAKLVEAEAERAGDGSSQSPTLTKGTGFGVILGTAAYMSPEQARGKAVDKRMDVWAYGCCLYEALTGRRAFDGDNVTDVLAAVVNQEPDLALLPRQLPPAVSKLIRRCLMKDPRQRVPDVGVARLEIAEVLTAPAEAIESTPQTGPRLSAPIFATAILVVAALSGLAGHRFARQGARGALVSRTAIVLPDNQRIASVLDEGVGVQGRDTSLAVSHDGSTIYFVGEGDGERLIYRRPIDRLDTEAIRGTEGAGFVFLAPDGEWRGFYANGELQKMRPDGDAPVAFHRGRVLAAAWNVDDTVVFTDGRDLWTIDTVGGEPKRVTTEGRYQGQPSFVPGAVLTSERTGRDIVVIRPATGVPEVLTKGTAPRYVRSGHIVFRREQSLWAIPFDADSLEVTGAAVQVLQGEIQLGTTPNFAVSMTGTLVYVPAAGAASMQQRQLVWVDRAGNEVILTPETGLFRIPRISPDQSRITFDSCCRTFHPPTADIWTLSVADKNSRRLTFEAIAQAHPAWTPDGARIAYFAYGRSIDWKSATGAGDSEGLVEFSTSTLVPQAFTSDGRYLVFNQDNDIYSLPLDGDDKPVPLIASAARENGGFLSPDDRWLAYASDESGRWEVYVRPFPDIESGRWQVSTAGGTEPAWSVDGRELFFRNGDQMMRVAIQAKSTFAYELPELLFEASYDTQRFRNYDVAQDGRFLMVKDVTPARPLFQHLVLVQNWFEELERLVPTND